MISLNQLDQLVSINQTLSSITGSSSSTSRGSTAQVAIAPSAARTLQAANSAQKAATEPLAFQAAPQGSGGSSIANLYNLYGNLGAPGNGRQSLHDDWRQVTCLHSQSHFPV